MANRIPNNEDLQITNERRNIPNAPAVSSSGATVQPVAGPDITTGPITQNSITPEAQLSSSTAESLVNTSQPIPFRPIHYTVPSVPDFLAEQQPNDLQQLQQFNDSVQQLQGMNDVYSVGQLRNRLRSTFNLNQHSSTLAPVDRGLPSEIDVSIEQANTRRALQTQNALIAPNAERGLVGVVRSLQSGQPFSNASNQSIRDFFLDTLGVDVAIQEQPKEEVEKSGIVDRILSTAGQTFAQALPGLNLAATLGIAPGTDAEEIGVARRIFRDIGRITSDRITQRAREVGTGEFIRENTIGRITPGRTVENVARNLRRAYGTPSAAINSTVQAVSFGIAGFENGRPVLGPGDVALDRDNFEPFESVDTNNVSALLQRSVGLTPQQQIALPTDSTFLGELVNRSADFRNLLRDLEPVTNEAGQIGFNPFTGHFGEFGSAGSLSGLLWLANLPEGTVTGALYDIADLTRAVTYDTRVGRLLGRVNPIFNEPLLDTATRIDTLGAFVGRDYGFTQRFSEDRYLSFIGNPGLRFIPKPVQIAVGFVADAALGGFTDAGFTDPVFDFVTRATRRTSQSITEAGIETATTIARREIDDAVARSVDDVLRKVNSSTSNQTIDLLSRRINNTVGNAEIVEQSRRIIPDIENTVRTFNLDDARPYSLQTAIRRGGQFQQLEVPFIRPRLVGEVTETVVDITAPQVVSTATRRLADTDETIRNLQRLVNRNTQVVTEGEQLSLPLEELQQSVANNISTQVSNLRGASPDEVNAYAQTLIERAARDEAIELTENGFIIQEAQDIVLDSIAPSISVNQITPKTVNSTTEFLFRYRVDPDSVNDLDTIFTRRTDQTISLLGEVWNVDGARTISIESPVDELSNLYRLEYLEREQPNLLSRIGKPVSENIQSPIKRIDFSTQTNTPYSLSAVVQARNVEEDFPTTEVLTRNREDRRRLVSLQNRAGRIVSDIQKNLYEGRVDKVLDLEQQLERVTAATNRVFADNPQIAIEEITRSLPDNVRPLGQSSNALRDRYVLAERRFHYENGVLRRMRADLSDVDGLVRQQQNVVARLPQLERYSSASELATRRREGLSVRTATGEMNQPGPDFTIAELEELVGEGDSISNLVRQAELEDFTEEQIRQAVTNSPNLRLSGNFVVRTDEPSSAVMEAQQFSDSLISSTFDGLSPNSLEEVSRVLLAGNDDLAVSFSNGVDLILGSQNNTLFVDFTVNGRFVRGHSPQSPVTTRRGLSEMKSFLNDFMRTNPQYDYRIAAIASREISAPDGRSLSQIRNAILEDPNSEELRSVLLEMLGEKYSKYSHYYRYGFRLENQADSNGRLSLLEYANILSDEGFAAEPMVFAFDPADGLRGVRNQPSIGDYYHGTKAKSLDVEAFSPTNELGAGLYLSSDINVARRHARALPAEDLVDTGSLTNRFTNQGQVFSTSVPQQNTIRTFDDIDPEQFNVANVRLLSEDVTNAARNEFGRVIEELIPEITPRWNSWSRRHRDMGEWWHYVRSQYIRTRGVDSMDEYANFAEEIRNSFLSIGVDALKDGNNLVVLNPSKISIRPGTVDETSTGSVAEGLLNRYAADLDLHNRVNNTTTEAILETDRLAIDQYVRNRLADAVTEQERIALRTTQAYNEIADRMQRSVNVDKSRNISSTINDANRDSVNRFNRTNRTPNLPTEC